MASELRVNNIKNRSGLGTVTFADEGLIIAGITSLSLGNSTLIVGSAASTGTANQTLQASGGAYVSGAVGIGVTNPTSKLHVVDTNTSESIYLTLDADRNAADSKVGILFKDRNAVAGRQSAAYIYSLRESTGDDFSFVIDTSSNASLSEKLRVTSTGNVQLSSDARISNVGVDVGIGITLPGTVGSAFTVAQFYHRNVNSSFLRIKATRNTAGSSWTSASTKLVNVTDATEQGYIEYNPNGSLGGLAFGAGNPGSEVARFSPTGNLGIGITNPSSKLEVLGTIQTYSADTTSVGSFAISNAGLCDITAYKSTGGALRFVTANSSGNNTDRGRVDSSGNFIIGNTTATGTASQPLQVTGGAYVSGNLGIGDTNPTTQLSLSGYNAGGGVGNHQFLKVKNTYGSATNPSKYFRLNSTGGIEVVNDAYTVTIFILDNSGNITAAGNVGGYSDIRLKDNIQTIPNALDKVSKLRGVEFDRNDIEENPHQIGVIAQEVEEIIPEVVTTHSDGIKSVSYGNLVGLLIEAIKDLKEEVNELKAKLEDK